MRCIARDKHTFVFDRRLPPGIVVKQGERFLVETEDSKGGATRTPDTATTETLIALRKAGWPGLRLTGPIFVEGAQPGDTLAVRIHAQECDTLGYTSYWPTWFHLEEFFRGPGIKLYQIRDDHVVFSDKVRIPVRPMIGCIGTTPPVEAILAKHPGQHGGNLDAPEVCAGSIVYLPVYVEGALLALGDCHAIQSDGEIGTIEMRSTVTLSCEVIKGRSPVMSWPRIVTSDMLVVVAAGSPLDEAVNLAVGEMILWVEELTGMSKEDCYRLIGFAGHARLGNAEDRLPFTARVLMPREYLPKGEPMHAYA